MSVDVSVVVPVYNTELFLNQCVDSLLAQTLKNVEFIFVDDGSTDRSLEILREYQQKDPRITILQQKNQFAGVARNRGMEVATGKYIIFVDSDDFFEPAMLEDAFNCAEENQAEIVVFDFDYYDNKSGEVKPGIERKFPHGVFTLGDVGQSFFHQYIAAPWNKLFLHSFVREKKISFQAVRKCNDTFFTVLAAYLADSIVFLPKCFVHYRINNANSLQGNQIDREAFLPPLIAIKRELKLRDSFDADKRDAFFFYARDLIWLYLNSGTMDSSQFNRFYSSVKENLIPGIFDTAADFEHFGFVKDIYESQDAVDFLLIRLSKKKKENLEMNTRLQYYETEYVSKMSKDYALGHGLLAFPRFIKKIVKH